MLRVGLSGGIGSGKSTVSQRFAELGALVIDADLLARDVVAPGSEGLAEVQDQFGQTVIAADGSLDRAALGGLVFGHEQARRDLERITHPRIAARTRELIASAPREQIIVHDVPLLVEKHMGPAYHLVIIVDADEQVRIERLARDRRMTAADGRARMAAQASTAQRRAAADVWLDNSGDVTTLLGGVDALWQDRLTAFNENLLTGDRAHRPDEFTLVPYDDTWPTQAARLIERIRLALGELAVDVQHVGSTSVPGLTGQDVLDLQVGVRSLREADAPEMLDALAATGFPRSPGKVVDDTLTWLDDGDLWHRRCHESADPGRGANLHVRQLDEPGWRYALLFGDWLRAHPFERDAYARAKQQAADRSHRRTAAYAQATGPWVVTALQRADAWADRTGWTGG